MLYIEIREKNLILAQILNNKILNHKTIELADQTIYQGIIFNHKNLLTHLKEFIDNYKLKKIWAIINIPELTTQNDLLQTMSIFQFALILSKANIKIQKIISINHECIDNIPNLIKNAQLQNLLLKIQSHKPANPIIWFGLTALCLSITITKLFLIHQNNLHELALLNQSQQHLKQKVMLVQKKLKDLAEIKKQNESLDIKINKTNKYLSKNHNPTNILNMIANKIPNDTWLTKIEIGDVSKIKNKQEQIHNTKKPRPHSKYSRLEIVGQSYQIDSPLKFIEKLSKDTYCINKLKLTYLKKLKTNTKNEKHPLKDTHKRFEFKIKGKLL